MLDGATHHFLNAFGVIMNSNKNCKRFIVFQTRFLYYSAHTHNFQQSLDQVLKDGNAIKSTGIQGLSNHLITASILAIHIDAHFGGQVVISLCSIPDRELKARPSVMRMFSLIQRPANGMPKFHTEANRF